MAKFSSLGFFLLITSLLLGCSAKREITSQPTASLPDWYTSPPVNDAQWLNGVGSGSTVQEATQVALSDLLAKLSVRVESRFSSEMSYNSYGFQETTTSQIRSDVARVRISNYEVVTSKQVRFDQYVVLVRSDRKGFIRSLADEISAGFRTIDHKLNEAQKDNPLKRYRTAQQLVKDAEALMPSIWLISGITNAFNAEGYRKYVLSLHSQQESLRRNLVI